MTNQMNESITLKCKVEDIIQELKFLDVDGETMQYILKEVGMEDQMLRQLMMSQPVEEIRYMFEEREEFEDNNITYCGACGGDATKCDGC